MKNYKRYMSNNLTGFSLPLLKTNAFISSMKLIKVSLKTPIMKSVSNSQKIFEISEFIATRNMLSDLMKMKEKGIHFIDIDFAESYQRTKLKLKIDDLSFDINELITVEEIQRIWDKSSIVYNVKMHKLVLCNCFFFEIVHLKSGNIAVKEQNLKDVLDFAIKNFNELLRAGITSDEVQNSFPMDLIKKEFYFNLMKEPELVDVVVQSWGNDDFNQLILQSLPSSNGVYSVVEYPIPKALKTYSKETAQQLRDWEKGHFFNIVDILIRGLNDLEMVKLKVSLFRSTLILEEQIPIFLKSFKRHSHENLSLVSKRLLNPPNSLHRDGSSGFQEVVVDGTYYDGSGFTDGESENNVSYICYKRKLPLRKIYEENLPDAMPNWGELVRISHLDAVITHKNINTFYPLSSSFLVDKVMECFHLIATVIQMHYSPTFRKELKSAVTLSDGSVYFTIYLPQNFNVKEIDTLIDLVISEISEDNLNKTGFYKLLAKKWLIDSVVWCDKNNMLMTENIDSGKMMEVGSLDFKL